MNGRRPPRPRRLVQARRGPVDVVVLDRVADVAQADTPYCVHGRACCVACGAWCWLGDRTHDLVTAGGYAPLCTRCGRGYGVTADDHAGDHRRADGPH